MAHNLGTRKLIWTYGKEECKEIHDSTLEWKNVMGISQPVNYKQNIFSDDDDDEHFYGNKVEENAFDLSKKSQEDINLSNSNNELPLSMPNKKTRARKHNTKTSQKENVKPKTIIQAKRNIFESDESSGDEFKVTQLTTKTWKKKNLKKNNIKKQSQCDVTPPQQKFKSKDCCSNHQAGEKNLLPKSPLSKRLSETVSNEFGCSAVERSPSVEFLFHQRSNTSPSFSSPTPLPARKQISSASEKESRCSDAKGATKILEKVEETLSQTTGEKKMMAVADKDHQVTTLSSSPNGSYCVLPQQPCNNESYHKLVSPKLLTPNRLTTKRLRSPQHFTSLHSETRQSTSQQSETKLSPDKQSKFLPGESQQLTSSQNQSYNCMLTSPDKFEPQECKSQKLSPQQLESQQVACTPPLPSSTRLLQQEAAAKKTDRSMAPPTLNINNHSIAPSGGMVRMDFATKRSRLVSAKLRTKQPSTMTIRKRRRKVKRAICKIKMSDDLLPPSQRQRRQMARKNSSNKFDTRVVFGDANMLRHINDYLTITTAHNTDAYAIKSSTPFQPLRTKRCNQVVSRPPLLQAISPVSINPPSSTHQQQVAPLVSSPPHTDEQERECSLNHQETIQKLTQSFMMFDPSVKHDNNDLSSNDMSGTSSNRRDVLRECGQRDVIEFDDVMKRFDDGCLAKLGEGVYGEVFRCRAKQEYDGESVIALKVIPIESSVKVNGVLPKKYFEILPEVIISNELSKLSKADNKFVSNSFIKLHRVNCVRGGYPDKLLQVWDEYDKNKESLNDRPSLFPTDQHYITFEYQFGGSDVEHFVFSNSSQAYSLFHQVVSGLAVAEQRLQFEHRDLHWGNILVRNGDAVGKHVAYKFNDVEYQIETHGVHALIIDFTLSRLSQGKISFYQDLVTDDELFQGDENADYQFEIYRKMKRCLNNEWEKFEPKTNVFWSHYLLDKLINHVKYRSKKSKIHRVYMTKIRQIHKTILDYSSLSSFLEDYFHSSKSL